MLIGECLVPENASNRPMHGGRVWPAEEGYDLAAGVYEQWHWTEFWRQNERPRIVSEVRQYPPVSRIVDLGCGTGVYCAALRGFAPTTGVDPSRRMLELARNRLGAQSELVRGISSRIPLPSGYSDLCLNARSLCHEPDLLGAAREVARIVCAGGRWIVTDLHPEHSYPRTRIPLKGADVHIETFKRTPEDILEVATESGFWRRESMCEFRWRDLPWKPAGRAFDALDRTGARRAYFILVLRRIEAS